MLHSEWNQRVSKVIEDTFKAEGVPAYKVEDVMTMIRPITAELINSEVDEALGLE